MPNYYDNNKPTSANHREFILLDDAEQHFPEEGLYIGHLTGGDVDMPALVDLSAVKGLCFFYNNEQDRSRVNHCIENLVWRVAATVPSQLCDIIIYNGGNAGDSFNTHTLINKYLFDGRAEKVYFDSLKEEFTLLIDSIYSDILERMSTIKCAGRKNLVEYNDSMGNEACLKYQFIFLTDFPHRLTTDMAKKLSRIIASGSNAGIYVMMTWDMNADFEDNLNAEPFNPQSMLAGMEMLFPQNGRYYFQGSGYDDVLNRYDLSIDDYEISGDEYTALASFIDLQVETAKKKMKPTILKQDFETIRDEEYEPVMSEINVTVGLDVRDKKPVTFRFNSGDYIHAFILGQSGSGKSVLLNNIITTAILKYSPKDLMLYLMDFKGVEFNRYRGVKHTKAVLVDNGDPQMTLEVLRELKEENKKRVKLWQKESVSNIDGYNKKYPDNRLPQVLFVADECQVMFKESANGTERIIQQEIQEILNIIATQGRSQGIHMLLATQQLDETDISGQILKNLTECFLLMSAPSDSERLVPDSSDMTSKQMTGLACYYHKKELQSQVQTFFATNDELEKAITDSKKKAAGLPGNGEHYFCGSSVFMLDEAERNVIKSMDTDTPTAYVGHDIGMQGSLTSLPLPQDFCENVLFFGANREWQTSNVAVSSFLSLILSYRQQGVDCDFKVIDCNNSAGANYQDMLQKLQYNRLCEMLDRQQSGQLLRDLANDISKRQARPTVLLILGCERFAEMKRNSSLVHEAATIGADKGFSISSGVVNMDFFSDDDGDTSAYQKDIEEQAQKYATAEGGEEESVVRTFPEALRFILDEGPTQGVHVLLQVDKPNNILFEDYPSETVAFFKHRVILSSENKYLLPMRLSVDIDVEALSDDEDHLRAYYYPDGGASKLFTPYIIKENTL